ncbi:MAG: phosphatase PAP2 family protein [Actinomycetota bacterium]|nr:phosphatase PAP2 family protein [Actinomycetota bacterium]
MNKLSAKELADFLNNPESMRKAVEQFDSKIDNLFEPLRQNVWFNRLFYSASAMADHSIIWFLLAAIKALRSEEQAKLAKRAALALAVESVVVNMGVKSIFRRDRPTYSGERPMPLRQPLTSSFPSGHSSAAVCAFIFLSENDPFAPLYFLMALIIAPSRIHVKIHHASDVIGGLIVGWTFAKLFRSLLRN